MHKNDKNCTFSYDIFLTFHTKLNKIQRSILLDVYHYMKGMCIPNLPVDLQMVIMLNNYRLEATSPINCVM